MGLAVVARIYPYDHARAPSHREIIVRAKAYSASSPMAKPLAFLFCTLPPLSVKGLGVRSECHPCAGLADPAFAKLKALAEGAAIVRREVRGG